MLSPAHPPIDHARRGNSSRHVTVPAGLEERENMVIDVSVLPTHIAKAAARVNTVGPNSSADTFLTTSYLAEAAIKTVAIACYAGLGERAPEYAYRLGYELVRADGLGNWEKAIRTSTTLPAASYLGPEFQPLLEWATKKRTKPDDDWYRTARAAAVAVLAELGVDLELSRQDSARTLISALVQIRNKTKAHGAAGQDFFDAINQSYITAVSQFVAHCPVFAWRWMDLSSRDKGTVRGVLLEGLSPRHLKDAEVQGLAPSAAGVYVYPPQARRPMSCVDLFHSNRECSLFLLPNGNYNDRGQAESIDYGSGATSQEDFSRFLRAPAPLPPSETHGLEALDIQSNVFGNLPALPKAYVRREKLEEELEQRLLDRNHAIITLHGNGGVGKTYLGLAVAHKLAETASSRFDTIVWFSGRDLDLRPSGPVPVRPAVLRLEDIAAKYGSLFDADSKVEAFSGVLQGHRDNSRTGTLLIFDNFETMDSVTELHRFLDTYTHLPNKVLLTSRERAFKADYPIEVRGMERNEAAQMLQNVARDLGIEPLVTPDVIDSIYNFTKGHAYVMRVALGEIAKERRYVPPSQIMSSRIDIVNSVFERSFTKLSDDGRWVFLTISNWKSRIPELSLIVVLGQRGLDVEAGIDECLRLSLITRDELQDGQPCYSAPQLARLYGRKKLDGDPDRLVIQEDIETLRKFGVVGESGRDTQSSLILRFVSWCRDEGRSADTTKIARLDGLLEILASLWPEGWLELARFRKQFGSDLDVVEAALRRAVEELPYNREAWLERARLAEQMNNDATRIACLVSAVEADPNDVELVRDVAFQLCRYINDHRFDIPKARRGIYLASVRAHMEKLVGQLDATGLSRLAWLFLLEGDEQKARYYAEIGISKDPGNEHCSRILDRIGQN
jgi:hypothetical protein